MKDNFTSINVLIDASGSMRPLVKETIAGFNSFLKTQKDVVGEAVLNLWTFSNSRSTVYEFQKINDVPNLDETTYRIYGSTALLDALAMSIDDTGKHLASLKEEDRPSKVIFLVITDGEENASQEFSKEEVKAKVSHQTEKYNWEFIFMGANIDAIAEAESLGMATHNAINYRATPAGTSSIYNTLNESMTRYRSTVSNGQPFLGDKGGK
jgi:uncharacterized protein YegL